MAQHNKGSPNSLANAAEFHCGIHMNKDARDFFATTDLNDIINNFQHLMTYCAHDVYATYKVTQKLFPEFFRRNPHPVSFAALRSLGSLFLPTSKKWDNYINSAERVYQENRAQVSKILVERVDELIRYIVEKNERLRPDYENDPPSVVGLRLDWFETRLVCSQPVEYVSIHPTSPQQGERLQKG